LDNRESIYFEIAQKLSGIAGELIGKDPKQEIGILDSVREIVNGKTVWLKS